MSSNISKQKREKIYKWSSPLKNMDTKKWDVFISHASEDKRDIAKPLADFLADLGVKVWYDEFTLEIGDSLSRSIDKGLTNSRFGLVVLSPAFLKKDWPEYELRGLVAKELGREKVILPIWHKVNRDQVLSFSPPLADKFALKTEGKSIEEIGLSVLGIVRPDLLDFVRARIAYERAVEKGKSETVKIGTIKPAPIRYAELSDELVCRIRLIRSALLVPYPQTIELWLDSFKRDMYPQKEIEVWEHIAACYLEYAAINSLTHDQHKAAFNYILTMVSGGAHQYLKKTASHLSPDSIKLLHNACKSKFPVYEFEGLPSTIEEEMSKTQEE